MTSRGQQGIVRSASISGRLIRARMMYIQDKGGDENFLLYRN